MTWSVLPFKVGPRYKCLDTVAGAQTERRGGAGPAGVCLARRTPPAVLENHSKGGLTRLPAQKILALVEQVFTEARIAGKQRIKHSKAVSVVVGHGRGDWSGQPVGAI